MMTKTQLSEFESLIQDYLTAAPSSSHPVKLKPLKELISELQVENWVSRGGLRGTQLQEFLQAYLAASIILRHPHSLAHQVSVPVAESWVPGVINGLVSNPMNIYEMGPAAAALEFFMINYFIQLLGWQPQPYPDEEQRDSAAGVLTHGGSLANLTALVAARSRWERRLGAEQARQRQPIVLLTDVSHYSLAKAAFIMGLECRTMPSDECGRMQPAVLAQTISECTAAGQDIIAVAAAACNTPVGYFDPLEELAELCQRHELWLHVDGAHGASLLLADNYKHLLAGIEGASSITWDAHKMMRANGVCAMVLVRERTDLDLAFEQEASYLFHAKEQPGFDFMGRNFECTKAGIGLNFFHALACDGIAAVGDYISEVCATTAKGYEIFSQAPFYCALPPQCNILCFRPKAELADNEILALRDQLLQRGYHLSSTNFKGQRWLRFALMNPATTAEHLLALREEITKLLDLPNN